MLRITTEEEGDVTRFRLEGKLIGDWVRELERCWICVKHVDPSRRFVVDLNDVSFVDAKGKVLLETMIEEHVELEADNPLMASLASSIAGAVRATHGP